MRGFRRMGDFTHHPSLATKMGAEHPSYAMLKIGSYIRGQCRQGANGPHVAAGDLCVIGVGQGADDAADFQVTDQHAKVQVHSGQNVRGGDLTRCNRSFQKVLKAWRDHAPARGGKLGPQFAADIRCGDFDGVGSG